MCYSVHRFSEHAVILAGLGCFIKFDNEVPWVMRVVLRLRRMIGLHRLRGFLFYWIASSRERREDWSGAAQAYRTAVALNPGHAEWRYRRAVSLQETGAWKLAEREYRKAIALYPDDAEWHYRLGRCLEKRKAWFGAAQIYEHAVTAQPTQSYWQYRLGRCSERTKNWAGAARAYEAAVRGRPKRKAWRYRLAKAQLQNGLPERAVRTLQKTISLGYKQAECYYQIALARKQLGDWPGAVVALEQCLTLKPTLAAAHHLMASILGTNAVWAPAIMAVTASSSQQAESEVMPLQPVDQSPPEALRARALEAIDRALSLAPDRPSYLLCRGWILEQQEDWTGAATAYRKALSLRSSTGRSFLAWNFRYRYVNDLAAHESGQGMGPIVRASGDAGGHLLDSASASIPLASSQNRQPVIGLWRCYPRHTGLRIEGLLFDTIEKVQISVDDRPLKAVNVHGVRKAGRPLPHFYFDVKWSLLRAFPKVSRLSVATESGVLLDQRGGNSAVLHSRKGSGTLFEQLESDYLVTKKGTLARRFDRNRVVQERYLAAYSALRETFQSELNRELLLIFGTLLGFYRDGSLIPGDDDFDAAYVSSARDPIGVKEEAKKLVHTLVHLGYTVTPNQSGRLFKVRCPGDVVLDIFPVWFESGKVWIHNYTSYPAQKPEFLPTKVAMFDGVPVSIPNDPEAFLRGNYGPSWRTPDTGFRYPRIPAVRHHLAKAHLTLQEFNQMAQAFEAEKESNPAMGAFAMPAAWKKARALVRAALP